MTSDRIPTARQGQWYTRDVDDPVDGVQDQSAVPLAMVDVEQLIDPEPED